MKTLGKLTDEEIEALKSVGKIASNWYAVSYKEDQIPFALFENFEIADSYRKRFCATAFIEPWPMIVKDISK